MSARTLPLVLKWDTISQDTLDEKLFVKEVKCIHLWGLIGLKNLCHEIWESNIYGLQIASTVVFRPQIVI